MIQTKPTKMRLFFTLLAISIFQISNAQWLIKNINEHSRSELKTIDFEENGYGFAMGSNGLILKSLDYGETWDSILNPIDITISDFEFMDSCKIIATGLEWLDWNDYNSKLIQSTDCGETWTILQEFNWKNYNRIKVFNSDEAALLGYEDILYTQDGGENWAVAWTMSEQFSFGGIFDFHFPSNDLGYASAFGRNENDAQFKFLILKTTDQGQSWSFLPDVEEENFPTYQAIHFVNDSIGFAGAGSVLRKTIDGGQTWNEVQEFEDITITDIHFNSPENGFVVGGIDWIVVHGPEFSSFFISKTTDGGQTWETRSEIGFPLFDINFINDSLGFTVGRADLILKTINGKISIDRDYPWDLFAVNINEVILDNSVFNLSPNPAKEHLIITSEFPIHEGLELNILDINGRLQLNHRIPNFNSSHQFQIEDLIPGIYFLSLSYSQGIHLLKFIKH